MDCTGIVGLERRVIFYRQGARKHSSPEIHKAINRTVYFRWDLGTVMPKNSHWIANRAVQAVGGHVCK